VPLALPYFPSRSHLQLQLLLTFLQQWTLLLAGEQVVSSPAALRHLRGALAGSSTSQHAVTVAVHAHRDGLPFPNRRGAHGVDVVTADVKACTLAVGVSCE
jgi:hypothetical protein